MEPPAAAPRLHPAPFRLHERIETSGVWLFGFLLVALTAGHSGGFFPSAWAWTAFATWLLTACVVSLRGHSALGALDLAMAGGALAFCGWFALSALWSQSVPSTLDESFRYLAYAGVVAAALVVVERRTVPQLLGGVTAAIALLSLYALGTRLLPDRLGEFESVLGYRLTGTIGYWNGLGVFAVMGLLLALGFAARADRPVTRAVAGAALPVLAATMYFTFSRGAWLALFAGFAVACAVDPHRLQLAFAGAALGVLPAVGVLLASRAEGLTQSGASFGAAVSDGHRLAPVLVLLAALSAAVAVLLRWAERHVRVSATPRVGWAAALLVVVVLAGASAARLEGGSPVHVAQSAWGRVEAAPQTGDNTGRLLELSSNGRTGLWHSAWDTFLEHPAVGVGGGSYWQVWVARAARLFHLDGGAQRVRRDAGRAGGDRACPAARRPRSAVRGCGAGKALAARAVRARGVCGLGRSRGRRLGLGADGCDRCRAALRRGPRRATAWSSTCASTCRARRRGRPRGAADGARRDERAVEPAARLGAGRAAARRPRASGGGRSAGRGGSLPGRHGRSR